MFSRLSDYLVKPELYASGTGAFWDDDYISKKMLEAHLNPEWDAATRKKDFVEESVKWITSIARPAQFPQLLDLGCGPGIYAELFHKAGYTVTGIDFSKRSIAYAQEQTLLNKSNIQYFYRNYLTIDYHEQFDVITLIYCDYAPMSVTDRLILLEKVYRALKPSGRFIFDVFTPRMRKAENHSWYYSEKNGFWSDQPHVCLDSVYQYDDEDNTELRQSVVLTEHSVKCFNVWDHFFTKKKLTAEFQTAGFKSFEFYGDVAGREYSDAGETICAVLTR